MAVIRGESCFEKNAFEDTENPTCHQNLTSGERIHVSREIFEISKKKFCCFKALLTAYFIPWKNQF